MISPTQRTMAECRRRGWYCERVEYWNAHSHTRHDLLGFADVIALPGDAPLLIQTTTRDNAAARRKKIEGLATAKAWLRSGGRIEVWTWETRKRDVHPIDRRRRCGRALSTLFVAAARRDEPTSDVRWTEHLPLVPALVQSEKIGETIT